MSVYVDPPRRRLGYMVMCHLWADTTSELLAMVDLIGVDRRWLQKPPDAKWTHFDISKAKRALAVAAGAVETDARAPVHARTLQLMRAL